MHSESANPAAGDDGARQGSQQKELAEYTKSPSASQADNKILYLAYCLKAFLETAERDYCPSWPVHTPGVPCHVAEAAVEYRRERDRGRR